MTLTAQERDTYEQMWAVDAYSNHSPGEMNVALFVDMLGDVRGTVLDAGCGSGKGALALEQAGFKVTMCDLTPAGLSENVSHIPFHEQVLWNDLSRLGVHDWVFCCDVLEHIPTPFTMLVVSRLLEISRKGVFLSISLVPDQFGVWIGKPLHQTVQSFVQWKQQLQTLAPVIEARDLLTTGIFMLVPRVTRAE